MICSAFGGVRRLHNTMTPGAQYEINWFTHWLLESTNKARVEQLRLQAHVGTQQAIKYGTEVPENLNQRTVILIGMTKANAHCLACYTLYNQIKQSTNVS
jgi:hypothetical protein